jgi:molybdopterin converting factor small subunit
MLLGQAEINYSKARTVDVTEQLSMLTAIGDGPVTVDWAQNTKVELPANDLEKDPESGAQFLPNPPATAKPKSYDSWKKDFANWIYRNERLELMESPTFKLLSNPGESERDFRVRLQQLSREQRDEAVEKLRAKYAPKISQLEERKRRAEGVVARESEQASGQKLQTAISFGATLLSSFMGRKAINMSTLGRATTAARGVGRSFKEADDVTRAQGSLSAVEQQLAELDEKFKEEMNDLTTSFDSQTESLEQVSLKPTKTNIAVKLVTLVWVPYLRDTNGTMTPAWG